MADNTRIQYLYRSDRFGNPLGRLGYVSAATRDRKTDGTNTIDVTCKTEVNKGDRIFFEDARGIAHEYEISDLTYSRSDSLTMSFHATDSISELGVWFIGDKRNRDKSALECLRKALEGTRWQVGTVERGNVDSVDLSFYHTTGLAAVQSVAEAFGLEIVTRVTLDATNSHVTQRFIDLVSAQGSRNPRRFDFGRNLAGVTRKIDPSAVITRLYPYGKGLPEVNEAGEETGDYGRKIDISSVNNGKPYIEDSDATRLWGVPDANGQLQPAMGTLDYSEVEEPAELLRLAKLDLDRIKQPLVSYTADVVHLGIEGLDRGAVGLGDTVQIVDTSFPVPVRVSGRVLEIQDDLLNPLSDQTKITIGNLVDGYIKSQQATANQVSKLWQGFGSWNDASGLVPSYINGIINGWNVEMNHTGGYVYCVPGEGLYVYDRPKGNNPTMAIQIGGGYFRIANSKNSDGTWNWRTMGNGNGLVADVLYTGTIKGGMNTWNLETGDLLFQRGIIHDAANKNAWDLTNSTFKTHAMVATDSVLTGEFTSDSDAGDVHILNGIMDILHDINDPSKGVLHFRSGAPWHNNDVFSIFSEGKTNDLDVYTYGGGMLRLGAVSDASFSASVVIKGEKVTISPSLDLSGPLNVSGSTTVQGALKSNGGATFNRVPTISGTHGGTVKIHGYTLNFDNGILTSVSGPEGTIDFGQISASKATIGTIVIGRDSGDKRGNEIYQANELEIISGQRVTIEGQGDKGSIALVGNDLWVGKTRATQNRGWTGSGGGLHFVNGICTGTA